MSSGQRYLDVLDRVAEAHANAKSAKSAKSGPRTNPEAAQNSQNSHFADPAGPVRAVPEYNFGRFGRFSRTFSALEARCPDFVPTERWQLAVEDGRHFLARWGEQADALGWTARDLFGLHKPPEKPHPSYSRLSRYDETGLIWLLQGRPVVALTEASAAIQGSTGAITIYRRFNKPALGPVGDEDLK